MSGVPGAQERAVVVRVVLPAGLRTLAGLPGAIAIGCAFAAQKLDEVPAAEYDAPLHAVATERGVLRFKGF